jgi:hypothetical protein
MALAGIIPKLMIIAWAIIPFFFQRVVSPMVV